MTLDSLPVAEAVLAYLWQFLKPHGHDEIGGIASFLCSPCLKKLLLAHRLAIVTYTDRYRSQMVYYLK